MLQSRLSYYIDHRLQPQQFGLRSGRSLSTPLFILRRLTELFERHSSSLYILFLDWSQAFDSVSHPALRAALLRYGVPTQTVDAIMALYHQGQFFVQDQFSRSSTRSIGRGIRQGCPLSPYLFVIVLSALALTLMPSSSPFMGIHLGPTLPISISLTLNMPMTRFLFLVPTLRSCVSYIYCSILLSALDSRLIPPNANFLPFTAPYQSVYRPLLHQYRLVPVNIVPRPSAIKSIMMLCIHPWLHCHQPNILVPISLLPLLPFQISFFDVPKHLLLSDNLNHSFDILSFPLNTSFVLLLPLFNQFSYMEWSLKPCHLRKLPK